MNREELIDTITAKVLEALSAPAPAGGGCDDCRGSCASTCTPQVRSMVTGGTDRVSFTGTAAEVPTDLAGSIDHTLLKPEATAADIDRLCAEAAEHGFASVCVNPYWVRRAAAALRGSPVVVASVVGFPFGAVPPEAKAMEARRAIRDGAREIDMVMNIGALKSGETEVVFRDIQRIAEACRESGAKLKVIIETAYLTDEEKVVACHLSKRAKAHFVKTSTGYGPGGATARDVMLMREVVGEGLGVKASGGIRTREDVRVMLAAGASRIGASAGVAIVSGGGGGGGSGY